VGKAYLKEMRIQSLQAVQPDFPDSLKGILMSSYYGGRSEVHIRRMRSQVLYCDFLSMYPTICILLGLWRFVIASGINWQDCTEDVIAFLDRITIEDLQRPEIWQRLNTIVQVLPDDDILPVRAKYEGEPQAKIGLNHLTCDIPLCYTLADCIASKLLTGKCPKVTQAISFTERFPFLEIPST
jgi:hypothetical protein